MTQTGQLSEEANRSLEISCIAITYGIRRVFSRRGSIIIKPAWWTGRVFQRNQETIGTFVTCSWKTSGGTCTYEPRHDKTNKMSVSPEKTQISQVIRSVWSVFADRMKKAWVLSYPLSAHWRLWSDWADAHADLSLRWSDWADAQADLSLRWAHSHFVGFVTRRLNWIMTFLRP